MAELLFRQREREPAGASTSVGPRSVRPSRAVTVTASLLLCGVVAASVSTLVGPAVDRPDPSASLGPVQINGTEVLRPDRISEALLRSGAGGDTTDLTGSSGSQADIEELSEQDDESDDLLEPVTDPVRDPVLQTVTSFYRAVATAPSDAFDLLSVRMQGAGYPSFESSWSGVLQVTINGVRKVGPDAAVVAVRMQRAQGPALRTLQRVAIGGQGRIRDATLLAAAAGD